MNSEINCEGPYLYKYEVLLFENHTKNIQVHTCSSLVSAPLFPYTGSNMISYSFPEAPGAR